jgi:hypothetical protein
MRGCSPNARPFTIDAFCGDIFADATWAQVHRVQRFFVQQQHLAHAALLGVGATGKTKICDRVCGLNFVHRQPPPRRAKEMEH